MARGKRDDHSLRDDRSLPIFIHSTIDDMTDLSPDTMRVYMHLSRRADKSGAAWPSYQSIGDHCFKTVYKHPDGRRKHAVAAIAELVKAGLIKKEKRMNEHGQQTNAYVLLDPVTVASQPGGDCSVTGFGTVASQPAVIVESPDPVTVASPKGSPIEDTPKGRNRIISPSGFLLQDVLADPWTACVDELSRTLPAGFVPTLTECSLEAAGSVAGGDGKPIPLYQVIVPAHRAERGLDHFIRQAGTPIRRTLGSILHTPVLIEIVAAPTPELEPAP